MLEELSDTEAALYNPVADFLPAWFSPRLNCVSWERRNNTIHISRATQRLLHHRKTHRHEGERAQKDEQKAGIFLP